VPVILAISMLAKCIGYTHIFHLDKQFLQQNQNIFHYMLLLFLREDLPYDGRQGDARNQQT